MSSDFNASLHFGELADSDKEKNYFLEENPFPQPLRPP
jgi:hypothetical protein